jgi:manganese/zinc/iron transport system permease protein
MVVAPAAAARQWTDRLGTMVPLAGVFGAAAGVGGAVASSSVERLPTGPTIVIVLTGLVVVSILFAPLRGVVWEWAGQQRRRRLVLADATLRDLRELAAQHEDPEHGHAVGVLQAMRGGKGSARRSLEALGARGLARRTPDGWTITPAGAREAERGVEPEEEEE